ncbi:MAG TPA: SDR family oxidoreductase [Polyangia bacterium]|jgi:NAD(P)-dependent dehydrogenase (short-subunit alcohol dehydrogenase family)
MSAAGGPLAGAAAVVTGGGRGIGRAIALALAARGARVAVGARTAAEVAAVAAAIEADGGAALPLALDVADQGSVARFAGVVLERWGAPAVLVNNAGIVARGRLDALPVAAFAAVVAVNLTGSYLVTRAFLPAMRAAGRGRIVNVASIAGRRGTAELTAYCAAKHGVVGLTRALAEEVRGDGLQVNAVCPGSVDTAMLAQGMPGATPRMTPAEVARVVLFLAAEAPAALTGACVDVFG